MLYFFYALGGLLFVAIFLHWGANFVVFQTFPIALSAVGAGPVFLGYAVIAVAALLFVRTYVPETKGRSLEQIERSARETRRLA